MSHRIKRRAEIIKSMHNILMNMNHEDAYLDVWIVEGVPDGATDEDFEYFAADDKTFNELMDLFIDVFNTYKRYE